MLEYLTGHGADTIPCQKSRELSTCEGLRAGSVLE